MAQKVVLQTGTLQLQPPPATEALALQQLESCTLHNTYYMAVQLAPQAPYQANGLRRLGKLAEHTYWVATTAAPTPQQCAQWQVQALSPLPAQLKTDRRLRTTSIPAYAAAGKDLWKVKISVDPAISYADAEAALNAAGMQVRSNRFFAAGVLEGTVPAHLVEKVAALPFVGYIQPASPEDKTLNEIGRLSSGTGLLQLPVAAGGRGLLGSGITVGVGDDSDPTLHPDIADRVINHTPGIPNNHGAHVAGTVAGAGIRTWRRAGFAPRATVVSQWFSGIWVNAQVYTQAYNMVVTNNSYGSITGDCVYAGVYDLDSRLLDLQAASFPELLHAFAAGNDGDNTCAPFPTAYHTVLGGYQSAKNILTVGRTDYNQLSSGSSSSGPVKDGRLKPEITGLGIINSLNGAGTGYFTEFGTSMSSPNIAGGLALLYERYRQLHGGQNPPGALMKALLLNGARDVGQPGPDYRHGYGTMMLERSLRMLENNHYQWQQIAQGDTRDLQITVPADAAQLKVMLYWHDPAAHVLATKTLVHDLDLEVTGPGGTTLPYVLNAAPAGVAAPATTGIDRTNNHEQVVVFLPQAGNYTLRVKGHEVGMLPEQPYALVYDIIQPELRFTYPLEGIVMAAGTTQVPIAWEDTDPATEGGTYQLDYSLDNGTTWLPIVTDLKDSTRLFFWPPGDVRSTTARLRLSKGSLQQLSAPFAIVPNINHSVAAAGDQCFGAFRINWTALTATPEETISYTILLKQGPQLVPVATVSNVSTYVLTNLHPDSTYFAAVVANINGVQGVYGNALSRRPNGGNCNGTISDADMMLDSVLSPLSGRALTSTTLGTQPVSVRVRNRDNVAIAGYRIKVRVNGGPITETTISTSLAARSTRVHAIGSFDFSATGTYTVEAIVENTATTDPNPLNDTLRSTVVHLPNAPVVLSTPHIENFDAMAPLILQRSTTGLPGATRWDYRNADPLARLRSAATPDVARSGPRAITLDVSKAAPRVVDPFNELIATYNLSNYTVQDDEVRLGFYYMHHGVAQVPHPLNKVWARGSDADAWVEIYDLSANQLPLGGSWQEVPALALNGALQAAGQQFSTSTQVRFGQYAGFSMADRQGFAGYSFDDVQLFLATNDVAVTAIPAPAGSQCAMGTEEKIQVQVQNNMPVALNNIPLRIRIQGGAWVQETIPAIAARSSLTYTTTQGFDLSLPGQYTLEAAVALPGDNVPGNDTLTLRTEVLSTQVISSFPYRQDFELGTTGYVATGQNNSWAYGTPASLRINSAASGTRAWKTNLTGNYNNYELSYLYTPCFDLTGLTNPILTFSLAYALEDCRRFNAVCDAAWVEYSSHGGPWLKLGTFGEGQNWYDYEAADVWMAGDKTQWQQALINLPPTTGTVQLRFVLRSDDGSTREGIAIDDIEIFNGNPLPIDRIDLQANLLDNGSVLLQWDTPGAAEQDHFSIEVSGTPDSTPFFTSVDRLSAANLAKYQYVHQPAAGATLLAYRVVWERANGTRVLSPVRIVRLPAADAAIRVFPNPARDLLYLRLSLPQGNTSRVHLRLLSADGKAWLQQSEMTTGGHLQAELNIGHLPKGMYWLEATYGGSRQVTKWIKE